MKARIEGLALVVVSFVAAGACTSATVSPSVPASRGAVCPGYDPSNVVAEFTMPSASAYRDYLPKMGKSPELGSDSRPAYMVIYRGPVRAATGLAQDAVCVVQQDGTPNLYSDVSREGMTLPK